MPRPGRYVDEDRARSSELINNTDYYRSLRAALVSKDSFTTTLVTVMVELFGTDCLAWAPETLRLEVKDTLGIELTPFAVDKIFAGISLLTTDSFYRDLPQFIQLCNVLTDSEFNPMVFDPADSFEMAWAITEAMLLAPPDDLENAFSDDIRYYMGEVLKQEGIINPPDVLQIAMLDMHNPDPLADFSDDPELYGAFWKNQNDRSSELKQMLKRQLFELIEQLENLRLKHGNTQEMAKKLRAVMTAQRERRAEI